MSQPDKYRIAAGEKAAEYGHPAEFYELQWRMYGVWREAYFANNPHFGVLKPTYEELVPEAVRMILWKVARLVHSPRKRDTITDIIGYAETLHMMLDREEGE